jgi:penicillin-binding protein 2
MYKNTLRNYRSEKQTINIRIIVCIVFALFFLAILIARFIYLQVTSYNKMASKSDDNRVYTKIISPQRGNIYDVNGLLLAENIPSFNLTVIPEKTADIDKLIKNINNLIGLTPDEIQRFYKQLNQKKTFDSIPLKFRLTDKEIALIMANKFRLKEINVSPEMIRFYPHKEVMAHAIGYVGRINHADLERLNNKTYRNLRVTGKIGLEKYYEDILLGESGHNQVEVNAEGRIINILSKTDPKPGKNLNLFIDLELQKVAYDALNGKRGSVVAMDLTTGGIISLVSSPSFNPNLFVNGIDFKTYKSLNSDKEKPLFNRATLGEYPPASTIKPIMALALLANNVVDNKKQIFDTGSFKLSDSKHKFRNWKRSGHGWVDIHKSLVVSNDTFFYTFANSLGIDRIHEFSKQFNLGKRTELDFGEQRPGLLPSKQWKEKLYNKSWYPGETIISMIGQGYMLVTPMQLLIATAMIATNGVYIQPRMVKNEDITPPSSREKRVFLAENPQENKRKWDIVISAMKQSVHSIKGTAHRQAGLNLEYSMAGKTGTAQVIGMGQEQNYHEENILEYNKDHSLFIAFAPVEDPKIVAVAVVENSTGAASIVRKVIDKYLLKKHNGNKHGKY